VGDLVPWLVGAGFVAWLVGLRVTERPRRDGRSAEPATVRPPIEEDPDDR
jgi:hypothetical protein